MKLFAWATMISRALAEINFATESFDPSLLLPRLGAGSQGSGTIYVIRHGEAGGGKGLSETGFQHAEYWATVFDGSKFDAPAAVIAGLLKSTNAEQRMFDTVRPTADKLGVTIDTVRPIEHADAASDAAAKALAALSAGPVLVAWWSDLTSYLCRDFGMQCRDFKGYDEVLIIDVQDGKVKSMKYDKGGFVKPSPSPSPSPPAPSPAPSPSPPSSCSLQITEQLSNSDCVLDDSYGCRDDHSMYIRDGCRGLFSCNGNGVQCGGKSDKGDQVICSCDGMYDMLLTA